MQRSRLSRRQNSIIAVNTVPDPKSQDALGGLEDHWPVVFHQSPLAPHTQDSSLVSSHCKALGTAYTLAPELHSRCSLTPSACTTIRTARHAQRPLLTRHTSQPVGTAARLQPPLADTHQVSSSHHHHHATSHYHHHHHHRQPQTPLRPLHAPLSTASLLVQDFRM